MRKLTAKQARKALYDNHGGQVCPLYAAASTGLVADFCQLLNHTQSAPALHAWLETQDKTAKYYRNGTKHYRALPWARTAMLEPLELSILSIDAWYDGDGWTFNQWWKLPVSIPADCIHWSNRKLLKWLRDNGVTGHASAGSLAVDNDQFNLTIQDRSNFQPLYAIEYGPVFN